ncbi:MAG TPA: hypothetical protein VG142_11830 [Trebonia sp.]|nr:hypothetical protein [Trebonia sp.]
MRTLVPALLAAAVLAATGCSAQHAGGPSALNTTAAAQAAHSTPPQPSAVSAVPGTSDNEYVTGPFTVKFVDIGPLPTQYDSVTEQGQVIPENCAVVDVKNTSANFTGWVSPDVEFVKGHSIKGQVLDTEPGDPSGGSSGGESSTLAPGQSQTLYACPQGITGSVYVTAQLISVTYGTPDEGALDATTLQLRY